MYILSLEWKREGMIDGESSDDQSGDPKWAWWWEGDVDEAHGKIPEFDFKGLEQCDLS